MAEPRHLKNAPIREALIDIRVKGRAGLEAGHLDEARRKLSIEFPAAVEQRGAEAVLRMTAGEGELPAEIHDLGFHGFLLKSGDGLTAVQLRMDGFTFNRLHPYTSWEEIFPRAMNAWKMYCEVAQPEAVRRLALRYINRIPLPGEAHNLADYLELAPRIPHALPQTMSGFVTQVVIREPETDLAAAIRESLEVDLASREIVVLMDIDAYRVVDLDPQSAEIEQVLSMLRAFKNQIFFGSLTEKTVSLFA